MSIEGIRDLVEKERKIEKEIQQAKAEAARIIEEARTEARKIMNDLEDQRYLNTLLETETKKIGEKKKAVEKELAEELENLKETGRKNMERAVAYILKLVLEE